VSPASEPPDLDSLLVERGYGPPNGRAFVQTADVAEVLSQTAVRDGLTATVSADFGDEWFGIYAATEYVGGQGLEARRGVLRRAIGRAGFVTVFAGGEPVSVGVAVPDGGWAGLFCMATEAAFQRRGAATAALRALSEWAAGKGAAQLYLQVMDTNAVAQALYAKAGFVTRYAYHYRDKAV
jgi:GNAT superfamily N-acetyltransferase